MHEIVTHGVLQNLLKSDSIKGVLFSVAIGAALFVGRTFLSSHDQPLQTTLDQHTAQINALMIDARDTNKVVQDLTVTAARTEGKIDTINQKIDDDRQAKYDKLTTMATAAAKK